MMYTWLGSCLSFQVLVAPYADGRPWLAYLLYSLLTTLVDTLSSKLWETTKGFFGFMAKPRALSAASVLMSDTIDLSKMSDSFVTWFLWTVPVRRSFGALARLVSVTVRCSFLLTIFKSL